MNNITVQSYTGDRWRDAATVMFEEPERGVAGKTRCAYNDDYFFDYGAGDALESEIIDRRALSVQLPVNLEIVCSDAWPSWLLDLMPQGVARQRLSKEIGLNSDDPAVELPLLLRTGGAPIGNFRIKEAWEAEQQRIAGIDCPPLTDKDIATRNDRFIDVINRFAHLASGSSGVQGEWPKVLLTRHARDGYWYLDPFVPTHEGAEHTIVKLLRSSNSDDALIIASEAPYLLVAEAFGLNVAAPLHYHAGLLQIPRFDRTLENGRVRLHGQESLVSALGIPEFGHVDYHENYLAIIRAVSDDPVADTLEYVFRDVLNAAMGNPDNHGRNTAIAKGADDGIRLAPLYDFAPMKLSVSSIGRATRWRCLCGHGLNNQWAAICEAAACDGLPADSIKTALMEKIQFLRNLPGLAAEVGVAPDVINRAFSGDAVADAIETMETAPCPRKSP